MGETARGRLGKLSIIENRLDVGEEQPVPMITQALADIDRMYYNKIVIMDAPPGTSCPVIEVASASDLVILVAEPTPFGLNDLKLSVETMHLLDRDFVVAINRHGMGNDEVEEYCRENNIPVIAKIPFSRTAAGLYSRGKMMTEVDSIREEIEKVSSYILSVNKHAS